jgi:hypothetical protein
LIRRIPHLPFLTPTAVRLLRTALFFRSFCFIIAPTSQPDPCRRAVAYGNFNRIDTDHFFHQLVIPNSRILGGFSDFPLRT